MNSDGFGGSGGRPLRFLISGTSARSMFVGTGLPELEVGVPDRLARRRAPHHLAEVEGLRGRDLSLDDGEDLPLLDVDELAPLPADDARYRAYVVGRAP